MRLAILAVLALPATALAGDEQPSAPVTNPVQSLDMPGYGDPARKWESVEDAGPTPEQCRDRIHQVREATGQLERGTADPEEPLMIYAVDRRQDGCAVLVVAGDPEDIRPLPEPSKGPLFRRIPAN